MDFERLLLLVLFIRLRLTLASDESDDFVEEEECHSAELTYIPKKVPRKASSWSSTPLDVYHFNGFDAHISRLFIEVHLQINLTDEQTYQIYQGNNCSSMLEHYRDDQRLFGLLRYASIMRSKHLNPFGKSVVGVYTNEPYTIRVRVWNVNYIRLGVFFGAIGLFLMSASLVRNVVLYYAGGCFAGIVASLLIVALIFYRFTPKRWLGAPIIFGGWSLSFYLVYVFWKNFTYLLLQYQKFVAAYFSTVILISFAVCYRYGPPTDVRSHNLAQWALQSIALVLIYCSCQSAEVAYSVIIILLVWSATKGWIVYALIKFFAAINVVWRFLFPKSRRLLTLEEYERQGEEETAKALDELRAYCSSPEANVWKITSSLSDPKRFARFVDGSHGHISEEESLLHELQCAQLDQLSDDSGEDVVAIEERSRAHATLRDHQRYTPWSEHTSGLRRRMNRAGGRRKEAVHGTDDSDSDSDSDSNCEYLFDWEQESRSIPHHKQNSVRLNLQRSNGALISGTTSVISPNAVQGPSRDPLITDDSESDSSRSDEDK